MNNKDYSTKQEDQIAKDMGGRRQPNSGATDFRKGDVVTEEWLFEAKTTIREKGSFSIKKAVLDKLDEERFAIGKRFAALVFNFGGDNCTAKDNYYVVDAQTFKTLITAIIKLDAIEEVFPSQI